MTRSQLLARLMKGLRRDVGSLDSLYGSEWRQALRDLQELRVVTVEQLSGGNIHIYIRKQIAGRTR